MIHRDFLAVDLGAGSGRLAAGRLENGILSMECVHRFTNPRIDRGGILSWDHNYIFQEILRGMRSAVESGYSPSSIGIDTWGTDYALIDSDGTLVVPPQCYRDPAIAGCAREFMLKVPDAYAISGIQPMDINTSCRLSRLFYANPSLRKKNLTMLMMPDLFAWMLTGQASNEYTIAGTTGFLDAISGKLSHKILDTAGIPSCIFPKLIQSGTQIGTVMREIAAATKVSENMKVVAVAGHDTQSALHSLSAGAYEEGNMFLISGTWSLLGAIIDTPILTEDAMRNGFSNEAFSPGKTSLLQNITGMWILQRLKEEWDAQGRDADFPVLIEEAEESAYDITFDVDSPQLINPESMSEVILDLIPDNMRPRKRGDMVRSVFRSLATRYAKGIDEFKKTLPWEIRRLHIMGGASRNNLLNDMIASSTGLEIIPGEPEASAAGNLIIQARSAGLINTVNDITEIRNI